MLRMPGLMCAAMLCHATIASAQMEKKMDATVTVTGCVAAATSGGGYLLTNASPAMMIEKDKMATEKDKMAMEKDKMATLSYMLSGGENLRAHVGHKVEVVGTTPAMMDAMAKDTMAKDSMAKDSMKPASLAVKSLKMVSTTCP